MILNVSIFGAGKVGGALGVALKNAGWNVRGVMSRSRSSAETVSALTGAEVCTGFDELIIPSDITLITTPDGMIGECAANIADHFRRAGTKLAGKTFFHASGALSSDMLHELRDLGASAASVHPLQTFPDIETSAAKLMETYFALEGDEVAVEKAVEMAAALGARWFRIDASAKPVYHAAACVASNYLVAVFDAAVKLCSEIGIDSDDARRALLPLVRATVENLGRMDSSAALTGPIARGDHTTIASHISALSERGAPGRIRALYKALGLYTVDLARRRRKSEDAALDKIYEILSR